MANNLAITVNNPSAIANVPILKNRNFKLFSNELPIKKITPKTINKTGTTGVFSASVGKSIIVPRIAPKGLSASAVAIAGACPNSYRSRAINVAIEPIKAPKICNKNIFGEKIHDSKYINGTVINKFAKNRGPTSDRGLYLPVSFFV